MLESEELSFYGWEDFWFIDNTIEIFTIDYIIGWTKIDKKYSFSNPAYGFSSQFLYKKSIFIAVLIPGTNSTLFLIPLVVLLPYQS